jgi:hypothetical protein
LIAKVVAVGYVLLAADPGLFSLNATNARLDAVVVLVSIAFIAILAIGGWMSLVQSSSLAFLIFFSSVSVFVSSIGFGGGVVAIV